MQSRDKRGVTEKLGTSLVLKDKDWAGRQGWDRNLPDKKDLGKR